MIYYKFLQTLYVGVIYFSHKNMQIYFKAQPIINVKGICIKLLFTAKLLLWLFYIIAKKPDSGICCFFIIMLLSFASLRNLFYMNEFFALL